MGLGWGKLYVTIERRLVLLNWVFPFSHNSRPILKINVKKLFSLEHSVRALNHTSKTAQIILARTLD